MLQNGEHPHLKDVYQSEAPGRQGVTLILVQLSALWPVISTSSVHKDSESSSDHFLRLLIYIHDITAHGRDKGHGTAAVVSLLENLGFLINYPKCLLTPTQQIDWLGLMINSIHNHGDKNAWLGDQMQDAN